MSDHSDHLQREKPVYQLADEFAQFCVADEEGDIYTPEALFREFCDELDLTPDTVAELRITLQNQGVL